MGILYFTILPLPSRNRRLGAFNLFRRDRQTKNQIKKANQRVSWKICHCFFLIGSKSEKWEGAEHWRTKIQL
jgi:hypothetical protein